MVEEALLAERAGFHSIQVPDRHGRAELFPGALQLLTILARETERVAIGSCALVLTAYEPMHVAAECAAIDSISRGRLYMTLARGWNPVDWAYFGIPQERLLRRFLEGLEILRKANLGKRFSYLGEFFRVDDALLTPRPYQRDGFPIWGGAMFTPAIRRTADIGECWVCAPFPLLKETWEEQAGAYRRRAEELGKQPFIVLMRDGWVSDGMNRAAQEWATHYVEEMKVMLRGGILTHHPDFETEAALTLDRVRDPWSSAPGKSASRSSSTTSKSMESTTSACASACPPALPSKPSASRSFASARRSLRTSPSAILPRCTRRSRKVRAGERACER